jgi:hypothetical protein
MDEPGDEVNECRQRVMMPKELKLLRQRYKPVPDKCLGGTVRHLSTTQVIEDTYSGSCNIEITANLILIR